MEKKIKILALVSSSGSKYHRVTIPLDLLDKEKYEIVYLNENFIIESIVKDIDYLYIHWVQRTNCAYLSLLKEKYGFKIIQDIDDYWVLPHSHYMSSKIEEAKKQLINQLILADIVLCSTQYLLDKCQQFNDNCHLRENYIPIGYHQFQPELIKVENRKPTIGICGSLSHYDDWMSIRNQLKRIQSLEKYFDFVVAGYADETKISKDKWDKIVKLFKNPKVYRHLPVNQYINFYKHIDILLAPLEINEFNKAKCIAGNSLISTKGGFYKIEDLVNNKIQEKIVYNDQSYKIVNYFKYENKPTIKIITKKGYEIEGTYHHKLKIKNDWIELQNLNIGDKIELTYPNIEHNEYQWVSYPLLLTKSIKDEILLSSRKEMLPRIVINEDWGRLLGYMLGDGHFSSSSIGISCDKRHTEVVEDVTYLIKSIGLRPQFQYKKVDKRCKTSIIKEGNALDILASSLNFAKIARNNNWMGSHGKTFEVPKVILNSPKSVIKEFLKGLFEADGTIEGVNVSFSTKDLNFAKQIQILLLIFGIECILRHDYNKHYNRYYYTLHLRRAGTDIFYREIGFVSKHKKEKLAEIVRKPHSNAYIPQIQSDEIKEIIYGFNDVYDIEVENVHCYNANGIINHNSNLKILEAGVKSTITLSNNLYREKGISSYLSIDDKSYFEHLSELKNIDVLNDYKQSFHQSIIEKNKQLQITNQLDKFLI